MKVLVTGAKGFIGKNLCVALKRRVAVELIEFDIDSPPGLLEEGLSRADVIYHLAGVNRPERVEEFTEGNFDLTRQICTTLARLGRRPFLLLSSSMQALLSNPYGISKRRAEDAVFAFGKETGAAVAVFRLPGVFGKWCRPNYNSVVATFCHNIARDLPITVSNRNNEVNLVYVDDVCAAMMEASGILPPPYKHFVAADASGFSDIMPSFKVTLGELVDTITAFKNSRVSLHVPDFNDPFTYRLYATYLSYLEESNFAYGLDIKRDERGSLAEFLKSPSFGQIFISRTKPGITRGNHFHHTKTEKFLVVEGEAVVRFRRIGKKSNELRVISDKLQEASSKFEVQGSEFKVQSSEDIIEYRVSGKEFRVVDIPPGYTHSIENVGPGELVTLFWANQIFDPEQPDTWFEEVGKSDK
ncbi:MAG TPA: NAD-dependent epimerase/dehydratase family protein [Paludibacter sp.]|nr:NAD-dependent epimerase/dehydratase family protein [Paludibacter sp.]